MNDNERMPNEETIKALEDSRNGIGITRHASIEDLFKSLDIDDKNKPTKLWQPPIWEHLTSLENKLLKKASQSKRFFTATNVLSISVIILLITEIILRNLNLI